MSSPYCPDCGAQMQNVMRTWRCPWASPERWEQAMWRRTKVVSCDWPLTVPRKVMGLPDANNDDRATPQ